MNLQQNLYPVLMLIRLTFGQKIGQSIGKMERSLYIE